MPELPEVITIRNDLRKEVVGKKIKSVKKATGYEFDSTGLVGQEITEVTNIAKLLLLKLSNGKYIATHLNMSGVLLFNTEDKWVRLTIEFESGDKFHYSDTRMFGYFQIWTQEKVEEYSSRYGKTMIESNISPEEFAEKIRKYKKPIKLILLDQKIVSGIGNIYANDALYMSKIHPKRKANELSTQELYTLFENLQIILKEGVEHRGSTIDRYRDLYGKPGSHQNHFRIYGKRGQKCTVCGTEITYERIQERPTFYCENCQPFDTRLRLL